MPWDELLKPIIKQYPKAGQGRRSVPTEIMLRIYFLQQWYGLSDPGMEDSLYDVYPGLSGARLSREIQAQGYTGGYTILTDYLRTIRPPQEAGYEVRFETPAGHQAQVDFAHFKVRFRYDPQVVRVVWLFSMVLGHSRYLFGRFVWRQTLLALAAHYGFQPRACRPYRAKTQGEQGGAAVSLCPSGLLPGRAVRRPGGFEPAV